MYSRHEIEAVGLDDFRVFLAQVWAHLNLPSPSPLQNDIAKYLQHGPRRTVIMAFRGVGKSWITYAFVLWVLFLDPEKKVMVVSANQELAENCIRFCRQLIREMPLLSHLEPKRDQKDSALAFTVGPASANPAPSLKAVGITGQLTGSRADLIVPDDVEIPKNSLSHLQRERLSEAVKEFDAILKPGGQVKFLGTPQVEQSVYNRLEPRGYDIHIWPSEVPESPERYHGRLAPFILKLIESSSLAGTPTEPHRFPVEDLSERRQSYGTTGYALQFLLDTTPNSIEKYPLKLRDLQVQEVDAEMAPVKAVWGDDPTAIWNDLEAGGFDGDHYLRPIWRSPEMAKFGGTVMAIDPSGRGKDETGYAIVRQCYSQLYLVASGGFKDGFSENTMNSLAAKAVRFGVTDVIVETNFGGGMFPELLKPALYRAYTDAKKQDEHGRFFVPRVNPEDWNGWSSGQKELRILNVLEPLIQAHRVTVDKRVIDADLQQQRDDPQYSLVFQMTRMCRERGALAHEDRLEALSMACEFWLGRLDRDQTKLLDKHKQDTIDLELRKWFDTTTSRGGRAVNVGVTPGNLRWA